MAATLEAVVVNQRDLVDKVLARYPEEFTVFRELLQNADDAGAKNFIIDFQTHKCASNGIQPGLDLVKALKWLVKNDGNPFQDYDWKRLTKIAEGNPDERKIGAFGVGFYSVFSVTDKPIVKSNGQTMSVFYKDGGDQLYVKKEKCNCDHWTVIEMELKQESPVPPTFELTRFLVTSMTFLANIECVTISRDGAELSRMIKSRHEPKQSIPIPEHMVRTSRNGAMSINSVELISQEVKVTFTENTLVGAPKVPIARVDLEESERNPTKSRSFFSTRIEDEVPSKPNEKAAAPKYTGATSGAPSLNAGARFSAKCSIYSAHVTSSAKHLEKGLQSATKKKPPANFSFEMVFFDKEEHDKQAREEDDTLGSGSVFRGPQGLCPRLQGEHAARIFIGQSTSQTTGIACHMSGRFIPTVERGSIDLANGDVAKWNEEVLYVGGFLARVAYDSEMNKVHNAWLTLGKTAATELALYTMKTFTFQPSTPDSKVSIIIKNAFFDCSKTKDLLFLSDKGVRHTKDIRHYHADFAPFMQNTPILPVALKSEITSMIGSLPERLRVRPYAFKDVVKELESRCLTEAEMAACLRWWANTFGNQGQLSEEHKKCRNELLKAGKAFSGGNEIRLSTIKTFIDGRLLNVRNPDDPLPGDTIPPALIQGLNNPTRIQEALGWSEMPITHWLRHLTSIKLDRAHDMTQTPNFAFHVLTVLSTLWYGLHDSHSEIKEILEDVACIPTTTSSNVIHMHTPKDAYFPEADVFRDLPVARQELLVDPRMMNMLEFLGVQKRCDIETFILKAMTGNRWDALDLARYLMTSPEHADYVMGLEIFLCNDGKRRYVKDAFASTDINRQLRLPVVNCDRWDSGYEAQFLVRYKLREYPTIDELIRIASLASDSDRLARQVAFSYLCGPQYEARLEKEFDPAKFSEFAFIPGVRNEKNCLISHDEVFSDSTWTVFGFGRLPERFDKKIIPKLKIRDRPTATKLFEVLKSNPPKDRPTAVKWFRFLADKGVFSAGEFDKIADLKIVPIPKSSEQQEPGHVSPRECFLKSDSYPENHFYQQLFTFVDFGQSANAFLKACGVKERPECIDILKVLLESPQNFLDTAVDPERYLVELRMIAVGHKSLPKPLGDRMRKAQIFLGIRRRSGPEGKDQYKLCKVEEVLVADDMESCRTFGDCIFIAPQEELLEKFYSEMRVKSLSSCIKYTVNPSKEIQDTRSPNADKLRKDITEKIPIFLHEFDEQRFKPGMRMLRWREETKFFVRACGHLRVTKRLDFDHATELQHGREQYDTELSAETQEKGGLHVLWIKDSKADSYDIAAALCRMLFSTYKKNDVLSLMTILDTPIDVLERRGYDVKRILKEYDDNLEKAGLGNKMVNGCQAPKEASPPKDVPATSSGMGVSGKFKKWWHRLHKDPKLGEVKLSNIADSIEKVNKVMQEAGGKDDSHISNREQVGGGKKQKNVGYCDEKKVAENDLEACGQIGQIKVWKLRGIVSEIPSKDSEAFGNIISDLVKVFGINQTRCHVFWHPSDSNLMGFNRNDQIFFGLQHYIENHKEKGSAGKAFIDWYYVMAHEMAHVHTPYHDEHHELLFAALTAKHLNGLHNLPAVRQMFNCSLNSS